MKIVRLSRRCHSRLREFAIRSKAFISRKLLIAQVRVTHYLLLRKLKKKDRLRVLFLAIHESVWKLDKVFRLMQEDPLFDPIILVCPYTRQGIENMWQEMDRCYDAFLSKGYTVFKSYDNKINKWLKLADFQPDIVFFTNPHNLTRSEYYKIAFKKYLSCYAGYGIGVSRYGDYHAQYNQLFHNVMWKIFVPHKESLLISQQVADNKGLNVILSGDPNIECLLEAKGNAPSAWKRQSKQKKKIIWAPHHTIDAPDLPYSTFIRYAFFIKELSQQFANEVQWAFKPHPLLKTKLYNHSEWGPLKTDEFYNYWLNSEDTQLEEGDYISLFKESDALIHDSATFLGEYLYMNKPCLFLVNSNSIANYFNPFGIDAYKAHDKAFNSDDIKNFVNKLVSGEDNKYGSRKVFRESHSEVFDAAKPASQVIIETIKTISATGAVK